MNREMQRAMAGAFLPLKRAAGEDVAEDFQGETPAPETLGWELNRYWKYVARYRGRVARRLGVMVDALDEIEL